MHFIKLASYKGVGLLQGWQLDELARTKGAVLGQVVTLLAVMNLNMRM